MSDTANDRIGRSGARVPRVHFKYTIKKPNGTFQKKEIPFIIGVMAGLSGKPKKPLPGLSEREFKNVDVDNFDKFLKEQRPRVKFSVRNRLGKDGGDSEDLPVEIEFESMEDFDPANVARQVPVLRKLLEERDRLSRLLGQLEGREGAEALLRDWHRNRQQLQALAEASGSQAS